jgi:hypothetical protein
MPSRIQDVINVRRRHTCRRINYWRVCATLTHGISRLQDVRNARRRHSSQNELLAGLRYPDAWDTLRPGRHHQDDCRQKKKLRRISNPTSSSLYPYAHLTSLNPSHTILLDGDAPIAKWLIPGTSSRSGGRTVRTYWVERRQGEFSSGAPSAKNTYSPTFLQQPFKQYVRTANENDKYVVQTAMKSYATLTSR